jgi:hypothetical protein
MGSLTALNTREVDIVEFAVQFAGGESGTYRCRSGRSITTLSLDAATQGIGFDNGAEHVISPT